VSNEGDAPADRRSCDPQIGIVAALMQAVADHAALVPKLGDGRRNRTAPEFAFNAP
jgi:hypothetical protein